MLLQEIGAHRFHQLKDASVKYFLDTRGQHITYPDRDNESLKSQYHGSLLPATNKFAGIVANNPHKSGENDTRKYHERMCAIYKKQAIGKKIPKDFQRFLPAYEWLALKCPKFSGHFKDDRAGQAKTVKFPRKRGSGRDAAKNARKERAAAKDIQQGLQEKYDKSEEARKDRWSDLASFMEQIAENQAMQYATREKRDEYFAARADAARMRAELARKKAELELMKINNEISMMGDTATDEDERQPEEAAEALEPAAEKEELPIKEKTAYQPLEGEQVSVHCISSTSFYFCPI